MEKEEKDRLIFGIPVDHDTAACNALREYNDLCKPFDLMQELRRRGEIKHNPVGIPNMNDIAKKYNTTIEAMKEHWPCVEREEKQ